VKVVVRPQFYLDVEEEVYWLFENAGLEVAQRWHEQVWATIEFLRSNPEVGRQRKDLKQPGIRSWRVQHFTRWLIFYGVRSKELVIFRVRSGLMNLVVIKVEN
jgi:plasmid stabilization system protein ParE